ncbi:MAG TPA: PfkB family carbohydrate kinase [Gaiellaceae bacterium]|jgi:ribokinase|nr:PfkB family carbohydrate kinase [Gaiellaceae bacterium]
MRCAVVGHVEWIDFVQVEQVPQPGEIVTALRSWPEPAGGGSVAAGELLRLGAATAFFTALGVDELGHRSEEALGTLGLRLERAFRDAPQRRGFTFLDRDGERTITLIGRKLVPHGADRLAWHVLDSTDAVYFCGGDAEALRRARRARVLVATARELPTLAEAGVELDALVLSGRDPSERYEPGRLEPAPRLVAVTEGPSGGRFIADGVEGRWEAAPLPGPLADVYGAGDCFAAGLAYGLGEGRSPADALKLAAERAALAMTRPGAGLVAL